MADILYS